MATAPRPCPKPSKRWTPRSRNRKSWRANARYVLYTRAICTGSGLTIDATLLQNKAGQTEYKVKWQDLNSAHSKWMTEEACKKQFGEATFGTLFEAWTEWAQVEEEWVGDPLPREVAAARWPKRERPGVLNYEAVIVNGTKICVGDIVRGLADTDYYDGERV